MLVCVGMYLPLETSFAIFIGGLIKGILDKLAAKRNFNEAQKPDQKIMVCSSLPALSLVKPSSAWYSHSSL